MYWADLLHSKTLEQCKYKSRSKKIEWLLQYFEQVACEDEVPMFEPSDIIAILNWLGVTNLKHDEIRELLRGRG